MEIEVIKAFDSSESGSKVHHPVGEKPGQNGVPDVDDETARQWVEKGLAKDLTVDRAPKSKRRLPFRPDPDTE